MTNLPTTYRPHHYRKARLQQEGSAQRRTSRAITNGKSFQVNDKMENSYQQNNRFLYNMPLCRPCARCGERQTRGRRMIPDVSPTNTALVALTVLLQRLNTHTASTQKKRKRLAPWPGRFAMFQRTGPHASKKAPSSAFGNQATSTQLLSP